MNQCYNINELHNLINLKKIKLSKYDKEFIDLYKTNKLKSDLDS